MNITLKETVKAAPKAFFADMTLQDLASALSALVSMKTTAALTSNLANHMRREALEDFADYLSEAIGDQIEAIEKELCSRPLDDAAEMAEREELLAVAGNALRPGELAANLRVGRVSNG